jgi:enolase-phosphatase E1
VDLLGVHNRAACTPEEKNMRAVLLDIEGTTTSISFVYDVLFPFAASVIPTFVRTHEKKLHDTIAVILKDAQSSDEKETPTETAIAVVQRQMANDVKATGLKQLQGLVWQHGYENGQIKGHVYSDVPTCFAQWHAAKRPIAIYSSGSILAQQLLFRHSIAGDLTPYLAGHYDTTTGPKREASSYAAIARAWGIPSSEITFCSDQPAEADAAQAAGMHTVVLMRPGNPPLPRQLTHEVHADLTRV